MKLKNMKRLGISSNWEIINEDGLENVVVFSTEQKDCTPDIIKPETCRCLARRESNFDSKPEILISINDAIKRVDIFSEGSLIEIFGKDDDYLFTCEAKFIDDWEGMAVYHGSFILPKLSQCKLKFRRIRNKDRLWIYCLQMIIDEFHSKDLFNYDNVERLLQGCAIESAGRVEKCRQFFEKFKSNSNGCENTNVVKGTLNMFNNDSNPVCLMPESKNETENTINSMCWFYELIKHSRHFTNKSIDCPSVHNSISGFSHENQLKFYISKEVNKAKADIIRHIDLKIQEIQSENNFKLEKIIHLLGSLNKWNTHQ